MDRRVSSLAIIIGAFAVAGALITLVFSGFVDFNRAPVLETVAAPAGSAAVADTAPPTPMRGAAPAESTVAEDGAVPRAGF